MLVQRRARQGETLLRQGDRPGVVLLLCEGLVKLSYASESGDAWIKSFIADRGLFGCFRPDEELRFTATAVEDCRVVQVPTSWLAAAIASDPALAAGAAAFAAWLLDRKQAREEALLCLSPEDRLRLFLQQEPELVHRLPQGDIARYLRVTPVAFSRIKRRAGLAGRLPPGGRARATG